MKFLYSFSFFILICGCSYSTHTTRSIQSYLVDITSDFFQTLSEEGTIARAHFTIFLPEKALHIRRRQEFRENLERELTSRAGDISMSYQRSAERVFFLPPGFFKNKSGIDENNMHSVSLVQEFLNGTRLGWISINSYWSQLNHMLSSGNANFINNLPGSLRADMSNPLKYILRVDVSYDEELGMTIHRHKIHFQLFEIGKERCFFEKSYPVILTAKIVP